MLLGCPVEDVLRIIPDSPAGTDSRDLRRYLDGHSIYVGALEAVRPYPSVAELPPTAIVRVRWGTRPGDRRAHWVLRVDGRWFDPLIESDWPPFLTKPGGRILSYFQVSA